MTKTVARDLLWLNGARNHQQQENLMRRLLTVRFTNGVASAFKAKDCGPRAKENTALLSTKQGRS